VIDVLNLYLEAMLEVIGRYQGTIDEIIGDAILVMFGAPMACDDHAVKAIACALDMQLAMIEVNRRLAARGAAELEMGIGIHTGPVIVGNIGSARRTKYAAVGSNVNLAGRIESFTTGGQILISEMTRDRIRASLRIDGEFEVEPKGATQRLRLYAVGGVGFPYDLSLPAPAGDSLELSDPLPIHFTVLEEKFVGRTVHEGLLISLSKQHASLRAAVPVAHLANLRVTVIKGEHNPAGEIYGKVVKGTSSASEPIQIRFTSVTPELGSWVQAYCDTHTTIHPKPSGKC
jgi:adenylate cyclase